MRPWFTLMILMMMLALCAPALAGQPFGQPFALNVGTFVFLGNDEVMVGFSDVIVDSRCPQGVWCFWEGDANPRLWLQVPGEPRLEFDLHTASMYEDTAEVGPYTVCLLLVAPYPISGVPIEPDAYVVSLMVFDGAVDIEGRTWGGVKSLYR